MYTHLEHYSISTITTLLIIYAHFVHTKWNIIINCFAILKFIFQYSKPVVS